MAEFPLGCFWPGARVLAPSLNPSFVWQLPFAALCESCLVVSQGYKAYAKLGLENPEDWYLMNGEFTLGIVVLEASFGML